MMNQQPSSEEKNEQVAAPTLVPEPRRRIARLLLVMVGLVIGQAVLFGPSLIGRKILLPLDILAEPTTYLPAPEREAIHDRHTQFSDLVLLFEPARRFAVSEIRSGRLPSWAPYEYGGVPFIWPRFSPFLAVEMCTTSPVVLAWAQMLAALVAGFGAYAFFRVVLGVGFWPAAIGAWCYPLTAFFVFWVGYPTGLAVYWLPWILLCVYYTVLGSNASLAPLKSRGRAFAPVGLAVFTALALVSGHLDVAGQVLLVSGCFALWCFVAAEQFRASSAERCPSFHELGREPPLTPDLSPRGRGEPRAGLKAAIALVLAWGLGFLLASPYILPAVEYAKTGSRVEKRLAGDEERPPSGLSALPQVVLPEMYGRDVRPVPGNQHESSAAAYAGVVATLFAAPLAFCSRRHRSLNLFWCGLALVGLSWCLNIPGFVQLLRLPFLKLMSHNRLVFVAAFSILALATVGLDVLWQGPPKWRKWFLIPAGLLAILFAWCIYRAALLPEPYATELPNFILEGKSFGWIHSLDDVTEVQATFTRHYALATLWCGASLAAWLLIWARGQGGKSKDGGALRLLQLWSPPAVGSVMLLELISFGYGRNPQTDPSLYYPTVPVLKQLAEANPNRVVGFGCLEANLAGVCGLKDIRGYDGVDPARMTELLLLAAAGNSPTNGYAAVQYLLPKAILAPSGNVALDPILDMLGVENVIFRGTPLTNSQPVFTGPDYFVLRNPSALPRVFVPRRVETVPDPAARLARLAAREFDPREIAYAEVPVSLSTNCQGNVRFEHENPTAIDCSVQMATPGLVVLADRWDPGWRASFNGRAVPILRVNHALRGVVLPAGAGRLEFRYDPVSFKRGLALAGAAALGLLFWAGAVFCSGRRRQERLQCFIRARPGAVYWLPSPPGKRTNVDD